MAKNTETGIADRLRAELDSQKYQFSRLANSLSSLMASMRVSRLDVSSDFAVKASANAAALFRHPASGTPITKLFGSESASRYFSRIHDLIQQFLRERDNAAEETWTRVFSSGGSPAAALEKWIQYPERGWEIRKNGATTRKLPGQGLREYYLTSPGEIIGPDDDFRIEYTARAEESPGDLSVVIGGKAASAEGNIVIRPEEAGYCFSFGGMGNNNTELQRRLRTVSWTNKTLVVQGRTHHCRAERFGGILRFSADGKEVYSVVDALPLFGRGFGYVSLYTCGPNHSFSDIDLWRRPTSITPETRREIEALRAVVLEVKDGPSRFVEAHYVGRGSFLFKDVTDVVEEHRRLEAERRHADKAEAVLHLAAATAHEMNQPLTVLMGYADLLLQQDSAKADPAAREGLAAIKESAQRLSDVVRDIGRIDKYKTKAYVGDTRIVDIKASSSIKQDKRKEHP